MKWLHWNSPNLEWVRPRPAGTFKSTNRISHGHWNRLQSLFKFGPLTPLTSGMKAEICAHSENNKIIYCFIAVQQCSRPIVIKQNAKSVQGKKLFFNFFIFEVIVTQNIFFHQISGCIGVGICDGQSVIMPVAICAKMLTLVPHVVTPCSDPWRSFRCCRDHSREKCSAWVLLLHPWCLIIRKRARRKKNACNV